MRTREPQWKRVAEYIRTHGSISRRVAVTALDVYELASRIGDAEKELGIRYERQRIDYINSSGEPRHYTLYKRPEAA